LSFLKKLILFINVFAAISLIAGGMSIYINPQNSVIPGFFGLLYPLLLLINIFFLFFWVTARFRHATISLLAILITLPVLKTYFAFHISHEEKSPSVKSLKVMSYNVRNFDLYNWKNDGKTLQKMMELIINERPDIACFQEFFNAESGKFQTISRLMREAGFKYYSFEKTVSREHYGAWGVATFSRYPIISHSEIRFQNSRLNSSLFTDVQIDSVIVRVFNVHLQSVYLSKKDYDYLEQVSKDQEVQVKPTQQIASKLKQAFLVRAPQAMKIKEEIRNSKYPVIVCGDFNDTPASFCYHTISTDLLDAFLTAGWGAGPTYAGLLLPYRIDFILCDKKFSADHYKTGCEKYSDHYPISCVIFLPLANKKTSEVPETP
jgi:endonuclease/exonuclease/phosphatase family metal-dependent hydrolase